jgi:hypothetical protein
MIRTPRSVKGAAKNTNEQKGELVIHGSNRDFVRKPVLVRGLPNRRIKMSNPGGCQLGLDQGDLTRIAGAMGLSAKSMRKALEHLIEPTRAATTAFRRLGGELKTFDSDQCGSHQKGGERICSESKGLSAPRKTMEFMAKPTKIPKKRLRYIHSFRNSCRMTCLLLPLLGGCI